MLVEAIEYLNQGLSVIPVEPRGKKPLVNWEQYQNLRTDERTICMWWGKWPKANVGIVTGKISSLVVIDCDSRAGFENISKHIRVSLKGTIPMVSTGNGFHMFFKHPMTQFVNNRASVLEHVDIRGDGGYVVAPPSVHPSGREIGRAHV